MIIKCFQIILALKTKQKTGKNKYPILKTQLYLGCGIWECLFSSLYFSLFPPKIFSVILYKKTKKKTKIDIVKFLISKMSFSE